MACAPFLWPHTPEILLDTAPSHGELLSQFPCLYKGHLHFPNCSCQKCEVWPETFSLSSSSKSIKRSRSAVLQNTAPVTSHSPPPHSSSKLSHLGSGLLQSPSTWVPPSLPFLSSHSFFNGSRSLSSKIAPHQPNSASKELALASSATMPTLQHGRRYQYGSPPHSHWPPGSSNALSSSVALIFVQAVPSAWNASPPAPPLSTSFNVSKSRKPYLAAQSH